MSCMSMQAGTWMGMDEGNHGGEKGGKLEDPDWNWMCTDGTYGAWARGIGLVGSMETVIIACRGHVC